MRKIFTTILLLLSLSATTFASSLPQFISSTPTNREIAQDFEIYQLPSDQKKATYSTMTDHIYYAKVTAGTVQKGDRLITNPNSLTHTFYVTEVYGNEAQLLLESGPKEIIKRFTKLYISIT